MPEPLTKVRQKWRFCAPQTHLWLIKHLFSASALIVKIATFARPGNGTSGLNPLTIKHNKNKWKTIKKQRERNHWEN